MSEKIEGLVIEAGDIVENHKDAFILVKVNPVELRDLAENIIYQNCEITFKPSSK